MTRETVLSQLANIIVSLQRSHPLRIAIDGIDASGKTTLADQLAPLIAQRGRPVIRASIDGFHRPRSQRYQQGPDSHRILRSFIEQVYNTRRLHSSLGYVPPAEFEASYSPLSSR